MSPKIGVMENSPDASVQVEEQQEAITQVRKKRLTAAKSRPTSSEPQARTGSGKGSVGLEDLGWEEQGDEKRVPDYPSSSAAGGAYALKAAVDEGEMGNLISRAAAAAGDDEDHLKDVQEEEEIPQAGGVREVGSYEEEEYITPDSKKKNKGAWMRTRRVQSESEESEEMTKAEQGKSSPSSGSKREMEKRMEEMMKEMERMQRQMRETEERRAMEDRERRLQEREERLRKEEVEYREKIRREEEGRNKKDKRDLEEEEKEAKVEMVKGPTALAKLLEPGAENDPAIRFGDWMTKIKLAIEDMSETSKAWWKELVEQVEHAYGRWLASDPLSRLKMELEVEDEDKRYERLRSRVASLLLEALTQSAADHLISHKQTTVHEIIFHAMTLYQPGGLAERSVLHR